MACFQKKTKTFFCTVPQNQQTRKYETRGFLTLTKEINGLTRKRVNKLPRFKQELEVLFIHIYICDIR